MVRDPDAAGSATHTFLDIDAGKAITVLLVCLVGAEIFFVLADAIINVERLTELGPIRRFFNITREDGVASWFAVTQTWMLGLTAGLLYLVTRAQGAARWQRVGWAVLALFFLYMAMDDGSKFHERVGSSVKELIRGGDDDSGSRQIGFFPSYTWQLVFLPIFGSFGIFILWFLNRELANARDKLLVVVAIGLLVLAVVADFFEGLEIDHPQNLHGWIKRTWDLSTYQVQHYSKSIEEFMEMLSMTILWIVLLRQLVRKATRLELRFSNPPS